jgi:hypothetical protein
LLECPSRGFHRSIHVGYICFSNTRQDLPGRWIQGLEGFA